MGTRERILDAAADIMRTDGIARATTKEIAKRAGFSEAALYKHFSDKTEIFLAVVRERLPRLLSVLQRLENNIGRGSVRDNLTEVVAAALAFYDESFSMVVGIFSERRLLEAHRDGIHRLGAGPEVPNRTLAAYLRAEQRHGRVGQETDPDAVASLLLGACLQRAFFRVFAGETALTGIPEIAATLVNAVIDGIEPGG